MAKETGYIIFHGPQIPNPFSSTTYPAPFEMIITTPILEQQTIKEYFTDGGRNLKEYSRISTKTTAVTINSAVVMVL